MLVSAFILTSCKQGQSNLLIDSPVEDWPAYSEIVDGLKDLSAKHSFVKLDEIGKTIDNLPIYMVTIQKNPVPAGTKFPSLFLTEGTHGNESLGLVHKFPALIVQDEAFNEFFSVGGSFSIVPIFNVDGYEHHRRLTPQEKAAEVAQNPLGGNTFGRQNKNRVDLNRTFAVSSSGTDPEQSVQPETQVLMNALDKATKSGAVFKASIDYHCCIKSGVFLIPYGYAHDNILKDEQKKQIEPYIETFGRNLTNSQVGVPYKFAGYLANGLIQDHMFDTYGAAGFTYEGDENDRSPRTEPHISMLAEMALIAKKDFTPVPVNATIPYFLYHEKRISVSIPETDQASYEAWISPIPQTADSQIQKIALGGSPILKNGKKIFEIPNQFSAPISVSIVNTQSQPTPLRIVSISNQ